MLADLAQARVRPEAEHARVPEAPLGDQLRRQPRLGLLHEPRHRVPATLQRLAGHDVAVGRRRRRRRDPERHDPPLRRQPRRRRRRRGEPGRVRDEMVGRHQHHDRRRIAPRRQAGGQRHRRQRVAPLGLERDLDLDPHLLRLLDDHEPRGLGADDDRRPEDLVGQPPERALEGRSPAEDRHMLLGEVLPRHRPEPRARPAAEDGGNDETLAQARLAGADGRMLRHYRFNSSKIVGRRSIRVPRMGEKVAIGRSGRPLPAPGPPAFGRCPRPHRILSEGSRTNRR